MLLPIHSSVGNCCAKNRFIPLETYCENETKEGRPTMPEEDGIFFKKWDNYPDKPAGDALLQCHPARDDRLPHRKLQDSLLHARAGNFPIRPRRNDHCKYQPHLLLSVFPGRKIQREKKDPCSFYHLLSFQHRDADLWSIRFYCDIIWNGLH